MKISAVRHENVKERVNQFQVEADANEIRFWAEGSRRRSGAIWSIECEAALWKAK